MASEIPGKKSRELQVFLQRVWNFTSAVSLGWKHRSHFAAKWLSEGGWGGGGQPGCNLSWRPRCLSPDRDRADRPASCPQPSALTLLRLHSTGRDGCALPVPVPRGDSPSGIIYLDSSRWSSIQQLECAYGLGISWAFGWVAVRALCTWYRYTVYKPYWNGSVPQEIQFYAS